MGQWSGTWEGFKASSEIVILFPDQSETYYTVQLTN